LSQIGTLITVYSMKAMERNRRVACRGAQKTPLQWQKFLSVGSNKAQELIKFLFNTWKQIYTGDVELYVAHGETCHKLLQNSAALEITELGSDHEEADTRIFLHAKHASMTYGHIVIRSIDTDVYVLSLALASNLPCQLYLFNGTGNKSRIVNISLLVEQLGSQLCRALIGLHIFTGCGSVSSFHGKGKRKAFAIAKESPEYLEAFATLGNLFDLDSVTFEVLQKFVSQLYNQKCQDVNKARYKVMQCRDMDFNTQSDQAVRSLGNVDI